MNTRLKKLPHGCGSLQQHGKTFWLVYRDVATGKMMQENSGTADRDVALRVLADRAIATLQEKIRRIRAAVADDQGHVPRPAAATGGRRAAGTRAQDAGRGRAARKGAATAKGPKR